MWNKTKEFVKRFFPVSAQTHIAQTEQLLRAINQIQDQQIISQNAISEQVSELEKLIGDLKTRTTQQQKKMEQLINNIETKYIRTQPKPSLFNFVLNILDHCNLKCKGCDHFASIAEERFVALDSIVNDLHQISLITRQSVAKIGIMGGETLLHPDLLAILKAARKEFPRTTIRIVTNGILLPQQKEGFWEVCRDNKIVIETTKYPINVDYDKIVQIAESKGVDFAFYNPRQVIKTSSKMPLDVNGMQDARRSFWNCYHVNSCQMLMEGKLYPCTISPNVIHFNKKFGTSMELEEGDYLNIYEVDNVKSLLDFLSTPKPFCRYCRTTERSFGHEWERSKQDINEWT